MDWNLVCTAGRIRWPFQKWSVFSAAVCRISASFEFKAAVSFRPRTIIFGPKISEFTVHCVVCIPSEQLRPQHVERVLCMPGTVTLNNLPRSHFTTQNGRLPLNVQKIAAFKTYYHFSSFFFSFSFWFSLWRHNERTDIPLWPSGNQGNCQYDKPSQTPRHVWPS